MTCELKTFELALNMLKFNLEGRLNFERTPLKLERAIKSKNNNGERSLWGRGGGRGKGKWGSRQFVFLGRNFSRPKA
jgi:hypothetical protein